MFYVYGYDCVSDCVCLLLVTLALEMGSRMLLIDCELVLCCCKLGINPNLTNVVGLLCIDIQMFNDWDGQNLCFCHLADVPVSTYSQQTDILFTKRLIQ